MKSEALVHYNNALKAGQRYYRNAVASGKYPYLLALDEVLSESTVAGYQKLGLLEIPTDHVIGTRYAGRKEVFAGNFMPLLNSNSEFAAKWAALCDAHLSSEGIHDPIECVEYLGRFYVQEGNKRFSVLKSYGSPRIQAFVTRIIPRDSDVPEIQMYYEFLHFYSLSGLYGVEFRHPGGYAKLQAALGLGPDQHWTEEQRKHFSNSFLRFQNAMETVSPNSEETSSAEALLVWLQLFPFREIDELSDSELTERLKKLLPDVETEENERSISLSTEPTEKAQTVIDKLLNTVRPEHLNIAFLYSCPPGESNWVQAHDDGRAALEEHLGSHVTVKTWIRDNCSYDEMLEAAIADGAELVFATDASMVTACRKAAALHKNVRFLACAVFQPYTGVRMYNGRTYECKFVTGAIAGAMAGSDPIGYVANNPIYGTPASVNAFALGARMTNPNVQVLLDWACLPGDPVQRLLGRGVKVVSNREIVSPSMIRKSFEVGTFRLQDDGSLLPLASPFWNWGQLYEKIVHSIFSGTWNEISASHAINYWWGMGSGVLDVHLNEQLPDSLKGLGRILMDGIRSGSILPFRMRMFDQAGVLRNDGTRSLSPEEILSMDWFCDNVLGQLPALDQIRAENEDTVRVLGLDRASLLPETEGGQL